jgi:hypothetical protein
MADQHVFLSYSHDELPFVRSVASELRKRGVDAGFETRESVVGEALWERFTELLRSSSALVVFIGKTPDSPWMNFEIGAAMGQSKPVVPVFLSRHARQFAPPAVKGLQGIDASNLKPEQVAEEVADVIARAS